MSKRPFPPFMDDAMPLYAGRVRPDLPQAPGGALRLLALGGSTRPDSSSEQALRIAVQAARGTGAEVEVLTGRRLMLPIYDTETTERSEEAQALLSALRRAEGLIVSSPGYHGTMSGMIKNVLDYVEDLRADERVYLDGMAVGCIAVAYGWQATATTLGTLRTTVHALRGWPTPLGATVNASTSPFDASGACTEESTRFQLETVAYQVVEFATMRRANRTVARTPAN